MVTFARAHSNKAFALVLCFAFASQTHSMQEEKHWKDAKKYYLLLDGNRKCVKSFLTWEKGLSKNTAEDVGKSIFEIEPFARLERSEKQKLRDALDSIMCRAGKEECKLSYVDKRTCLGILLKVNRVVSDNDLRGYLVRYSQFFSTGDTPIFEIKEEPASVVEAVIQNLAESTQQTATEFERFMEDEREGCAIL